MSGTAQDALDLRRERGAASALVNASTHAFAASLVGVGVGLATSIVVSRALGPQEKGVYDLVLSTAMLLALVLGLSLPSGITFSVARGTSSPRALVGWVVVAGAVQSVVAFVVLELLSATDLTSSLGLGSYEGAAVVVLPLLTAILCVAPSLRGILVGEQLVARASWLDLLGRVITFVLLLVVAVVGAGPAATADRFLTALLAGTAIAAALFLPAALRSRLPGAGAGLRTVVRFSVPSYGANVLQYLNYRVDLFLVAYFRDLREVGLYALAVSLAQLVWLVSNAVGTAVFARVGSGSDEPRQAAEHTATLFRCVLSIQVVLAAALALVVKPLLPALYGDAFAQAVSAVWLLLPGIAVFGAGSVLAAHIAGLGRPHLNMHVAAVSLAVTLGLDLLLIPSLGMNGAALASSASYATTTALMVLIFGRVARVRARVVLVPRRADLQSLLALARSSRR